MSKVLVTGATGYTGRHVCKKLLEEGFDVHALVRENSNLQYLNELTNYQVTCHVYNREQDNLLSIIYDTAPDIVFHIAAKISSKDNYDEIEDMIQSNITFATKLIHAMVKSGCKKFVNTSTSWLHYDQDMYNPVCLYAASKKAFADILQYYHAAYKLDYITMELFDSYGADDNRKKLMNLIKDAVQKGIRLDTTEGKQEIGLVYIDDLAEAYFTAGSILLKNTDIGKTYMVRPDEILTLRELVARIQKITGKDIDVNWGYYPYRDREVMTAWKSGENLPGWEQKIHIIEGIRRFFEVRD